MYIGSNFEISVGEVHNLIKEITGSNVVFITEEQRLRPEKSEVLRLWCDNTRIERLTGFKPKYNIRQRLEKTIEWLTMPHNLAKYKVDIYNV